MKIILILLLVTSAGSHSDNKREVLYFETMEQCLQILKETKIVGVPSDDNEWIGAATCGYKQE